MAKHQSTGYPTTCQHNTNLILIGFAKLDSIAKHVVQKEYIKNIIMYPTASTDPELKEGGRQSHLTFREPSWNQCNEILNRHGTYWGIPYSSVATEGQSSALLMGASSPQLLLERRWSSGVLVEGEEPPDSTLQSRHLLWQR